uniref:xaa-Pro aminopeptidase 2 n=1 Tax=Euleptes europaea TaxID=460621 RepID=UPI0025424213|nr:xaa-Pro aminopeptidase 2 [Euleptes europaea]
MASFYCVLGVWISLLHSCVTGYPKQKTSGSEDIRNCTVTPPYLPPTVTNTGERLSALRQLMRSHNLTVYIIPSKDAHMSEYIAERDKRLSWMTGFTGSSGIGVVTLQKAALFTDSRYWTQAERQMDCNWELQKSVWIASIGEWTHKEVPAGGKVGLDPYLVSIDDWQSYNEALEDSNWIPTPIEDNLVDLVWGAQRPPPPVSEIYQLPDNFTERKILGPPVTLSGDPLDTLGKTDGTTDITRTVHWGEPTPFQKEAYTRVLMGNIDLSRLTFPARTSGRMVEAFARQALWEVGLNYGHGTGHGIGNFLSVHEWPVGFQTKNIPFEKGMFTSIEPGYYQDGEFGIRLEDVVLVVEAESKYQVSETPYLTFKVISLVPYDRSLIDVKLLSQEQIKYLNSYYETIRKLVGPELERDRLHEEYSWLQENTKPFSRATLMAASLGILAMSALTSTLLTGM